MPGCTTAGTRVVFAVVSPAVVIRTRSPYVIQCINTYMCDNEVNMYVTVRVGFFCECSHQARRAPLAERHHTVRTGAHQQQKRREPPAGKPQITGWKVAHLQGDDKQMCAGCGLARKTKPCHASKPVAQFLSAQ